MALGKRKAEQQAAWVATTELPKSPGHPFYKKLNKLLAQAGFDEWLEKLCAPHYAAKMGRDSIPPGVYFRMMLIGYFEGIRRSGALPGGAAIAARWPNSWASRSTSERPTTPACRAFMAACRWKFTRPCSRLS